jgi:hypothetical protein
MIEIAIDRDDVSPCLRELYDAVRPEVLLKLAGKSVENALRDHFLSRNREPNKKGWPKRGLWGEIAEQTAMGAVNAEEVVVTVKSPALAHKIAGGTIRPGVGKKYLALPATAAAYAAGSPSEGAAPELKFGVAFNPEINRNMKAMLSKDGNTVWYWLARKATHKADPDAMPSDTTLEDAAIETIERALQRRKEASAA